MKKAILPVILFLLLPGLFLSAQVAVNTNGSSAAGSAMLDVSSTNKGLLTPRMTLAQRNAISSPATGLLIYQTDNIPGFYYYNGTSWTAMSGSSGGGGGTSSTHYVGEPYLGGIVYWVSATGDSGLVVSLVDLGDQFSGEMFNCNLNDSYARSDWYGKGNTAEIIAFNIENNIECESFAAKVCNDYTAGGSGWYLPSRTELVRLWTNLYEVHKAFDKLNAVTPGSASPMKTFEYWSSTTAENVYGYVVDFFDGDVDKFYKNSNHFVRAVKFFKP